MTSVEGYPIVLVVDEKEFAQFELNDDLRTLPKSTGDHFDLQQRGESFVEQRLMIAGPYDLTDVERELYKRMADVVGTVPEEAPLSGLSVFNPEWSVGDRLTLRVVWFAFRRCFPAEANRIRRDLDIGPIERQGSTRIGELEETEERS